MGYLEKLQKVKSGDFVYVKERDYVSGKHKIISINEDIVTLDCDGNDDLPWKFSIKTSNAVTAPFSYWISTDKNNNP